SNWHLPLLLPFLHDALPICVDGIYTADPLKDATATRFEELSFQDIYDRGLSVMDMTAFTLCHENNLPIIVFDMNKEGNFLKLVQDRKSTRLNSSHVKISYAV